MTARTSSETAAPAGSGSNYDSEKPPVTDLETVATHRPVDADNNAGGSQDSQSHQGRQIRGVRWALACVAIFSANLLYGLDSTIAADLQSAVSISLDNVTELGWLGYGFCLGSTVSILPLGKAYAVLDVKWVYIASLTMFSAGSALCGAAPSMAALIVGRIWAGSGGAGMYLGTINIVTTLTTEHEQAFWLSFQGVVYGTGCILGPVIGGLFTDSSATWRWSFYLNLLVFAVTAPFGVFCLPSMLRRDASMTVLNVIRSQDWLGIVLSAAACVCFVLAFSFGGAIWAWSDGRFIALVVLAAVLATAFVVTQRYSFLTTPQNRLFPCQFVSEPQFILYFITIACTGSGAFIILYYIPLYFQFVHGDSGTRTAVRLLPFIVFFIVSMMLCGYFLPRRGYHTAWLWYLGSGLLLTAGGAALYTIGYDTAPAKIYGYSILVGSGMAVTQASYTVASHRLAVRFPERIASMPDAMQFLNIGQGSAQMIGLLVASAVFQSEALKGMLKVLDGKGYTRAQIQGAIAGSQSRLFDTMNAALRRQCLDVIVHTIQKEFILVITAGALLTVCSLFVSRRK